MPVKACISLLKSIALINQHFLLLTLLFLYLTCQGFKLVISSEVKVSLKLPLHPFLITIFFGVILVNESHFFPPPVFLHLLIL